VAITEYDKGPLNKKRPLYLFGLNKEKAESQSAMTFIETESKKFDWKWNGS